MRLSWPAYIVVGVVTFAAAYQVGNRSHLLDAPPAADQADEVAPHSVGQKSDRLPRYDRRQSSLPDDVVVPVSLKPAESPAPADEDLQTGSLPAAASAPDDNHPKGALSYLADYAYSEVLPETKPADFILKALGDIPRGTPAEEIKRVSDLFGLDFNFMKAVAKIESDFNPKQRTGSYIGLFQLSNAEFQKFGSGDIRDSRDNAVAAAYKFMTEAILFEISTHKKPTLSDFYLIHQQGVQGAEEHVSHPDQLAWKSMCATDEGREKGERWCKRAIWGNTLPAVKHAWKTVDNLTSEAFVGMWRQRVSQFYARYSEAN